jgi:hypothetical protein
MLASPKRVLPPASTQLQKELQNAVKEVDVHASLLFYVVSIDLIKGFRPYHISEVHG